MNSIEQIMIDGCNVSECLFYQSNFEEDYDVKIKHFCSNWHNSCESVNNSNCYFKQLTRKTQECEELKNEYWKLEQGNDFLAEKNSRLKGCLAEIKEIAEPFCNACQEFEPEKKGSNCMYCNFGKILQKISECEVNND